MRLHRLKSVPLAAALLFAQGRDGALLTDEARNTEYDPSECYRVHDLSIRRADIRLYLTSGYLTFSKPVHGYPMSAIFTTDVERQRETVDAAAPHTWAWINKLAGISNLRAALDLGCGGGVATCFLALNNPEARVVGVDSNEVAIGTARRFASELGLLNVEFVVSPVGELNLGEGSRSRIRR